MKACKCGNCSADLLARRAAHGLKPFCEIPAPAPRAPSEWASREEAVAALGHERVVFSCRPGSVATARWPGAPAVDPPGRRCQRAPGDSTPHRAHALRSAHG
jgi:hypothetical protein